MELLQIQTQEMISEVNMLSSENSFLKEQLAEIMHKSGENPSSCYTSGSSSTSELVNGPQIKEVIDTKLKLA